MYSLDLIKALLVGVCLIQNAVSHSNCTSARRISIAKQIPNAYNLNTTAASAAAFEKVPFAANSSVELVIAGRSPIIVATNATAARAFANQTRQVFTHVNGTYTDFANGTTLIHADVALSGPKNISLPPSFSADVYLIFDLRTCQIGTLRAVGDIPTALLG